MRFLVFAIAALAATPILPDAEPRRPVASASYCAMEYFDYENLFIPCEYVPLLTPRVGKPPLPPRSGKYGPFLDVGQDI